MKQDRITAAEYRQMLGLSPVTKSYGNHTPSPQVSNPESKKQEGALDRDDEGKASRSGCPAVRFTLCRVKLLDIDAKYGSIKDLLDGLQIAGCIPGDREGEITLEVNQQKVAHYHEERTEIFVSYPNVQDQATDGARDQ